MGESNSRIHDAVRFITAYLLALYGVNDDILRDYYREDSHLTFQGESFGSENILDFRTRFPFPQCKHHISTIDVQPLLPSDDMFVCVSGELQLNDKDEAHTFSQTLHLKPTPEGSFYVLNDILRLHRELEPIVSSSGVEDQIAGDQIAGVEDQIALPSPFSS